MPTREQTLYMFALMSLHKILSSFVTVNTIQYNKIRHLIGLRPV